MKQSYKNRGAQPRLDARVPTVSEWAINREECSRGTCREEVS
jgi:hypothetical protein